MKLHEKLAEIDTGILLLNGFDEAFVGVGERRGQRPLAVYDRSKCIELLVAQGMTEMEALEYFEFNVAGAWVGERTPLILDRLEAVLTSGHQGGNGVR